MPANWDDMAVVGRIARTHGLRGEVIVNLETDFPAERFYPGAELFVVRGGERTRLTLAGVRFHQGRPIVAVTGIDSIDRAQELSGLDLRVPPERLGAAAAGPLLRHH